MLGATAFAGLAQPARPVQRTQRIHIARRNVCSHRASQQVVRAASDGEEGAPTVQALELQLFLSLLVRYPGLSGTVAATAGYFLNLDPVGSCHWNLHDATLGLQFAVPVLLLDAILMLPNYSPTLTKKVIKIKVPASLAEKLKAAEALTVTETLPDAKGEVSSAPLSLFKKDEPSSSSSSSSISSGGSSSGGGASQPSGAADAAAPAAVASAAGAGSSDEASSSGGEEMVDVEREVSVRGEQGSLAAALYRKQLEKSLNNGGRFLSWPLEGALLLTLHFAEEMLYRAVALTWAVGWTIDRLYEAGADETVGLGAYSLATPQVGAALALAGCTAASLGLLIQREFFPLKMLDKAQRDLSGGEGTPAEKERMARVLAKVKAGIRKQRLWSVSIEALRDASEWACYGSAFLLTGNLLAPYLAAVVSDTAFSAYQRMRQGDIDKAQQRASKQIGELRAVAKDMGAAKRSRVDRLQPPPLPRAPRAEEQPKEGSGGSPAKGDKPGA